MHTAIRLLFTVALTSAIVAGCGGTTKIDTGPAGTVQISVQSSRDVTKPFTTDDGWTVHFTRYLVSIGDPVVTRRASAQADGGVGSGPMMVQNSKRLYLVDFAKEQSVVLQFLSNIRVGDYDLTWVMDTPDTCAAPITDDPEHPDRLGISTLIAGKNTFLVTGEASKDAVTRTFRMYGTVQPTWSNCTTGAAGSPSFTIEEGQTTEVALSFDVDRILATDFTGASDAVDAGWIDRAFDGTSLTVMTGQGEPLKIDVDSQTDLGMPNKLDEVFPAADGYDLTGSLVDNPRGYVNYWLRGQVAIAGGIGNGGTCTATVTPHTRPPDECEHNPGPDAGMPDAGMADAVELDAAL